MGRISLRKLFIAGYIWCLLPVVLVVAFWFRWEFSVTVLCLLAYSSYSICKRRNFTFSRSDSPYGADGRGENLKLDGKIVMILLALLVWMIIMGHGGYLPSEQWDNMYRNAVLDNLVTHSWPVFDSTYRHEAYLSYYFAYWTPAAIIGKLTNSLAVANFTMFLYGYIGHSLTVLMLLQLVKSHRFLAASILILCCFGEFLTSFFLQYWGTGDFSPTGCLFLSAPGGAYNITYIYNQGIPAWLVLMMMYRLRDKSGIQLLLFSFLFVMAPFVALGVCPLLGYYLIKEYKKSFSVANLTGLTVCLLFSVFFLGNTQGSEGMHFIWNDLSLDFILSRLVIWLVLDVGIFLPFIFKELKNNYLFPALFASVLLFSALCPAYGNFDFGWKVPISLMFYLACLLAIEAGNMKWSFGSLRDWLFGSVLILSLSGNWLYIRNTAYRCVWMWRGEPKIDCRPIGMDEDLFNPDKNICYDSFVTDKETLWKKYLKPDYNIDF